MKDRLKKPVISTEKEVDEKVKILAITGSVLAIVLIVVAFIYFRYGSSEAPKTAVVTSSPTPVKTQINFPVPTLSFQPGQLVVKFREGQSIDEISDENVQREVLGAFTEARVLRQENAFSPEDPKSKMYKVILLEEGADINRAKEILSSLEVIEDVSENINTISQD